MSVFSRSTTYALAILAVGACVLLLGVGFAGRGLTPAQEVAQGTKHIQVETYQLQPDNGIIPVELKCRQVELPAPDTIEAVPCVVRNNTNKLAKAIGVIKSVATEKDGITSTVSSSIVLDAFVHPDINADRGGKLIPPGKEINAGGLPATYSGPIKGISLSVDFVEFEDKTELGPDTASFRQKIGEIRSGAAKYKRWLVQRFTVRGRDINALTLLLDAEPSPEEMGVKNNNEAEGASLYLTYARKVKGEKGAHTLADRLK